MIIVIGHTYGTGTSIFLMNYTLIAFAFGVGCGTGLPLVRAHQRVCRGLVCDNISKMPVQGSGAGG